MWLTLRRAMCKCVLVSDYSGVFLLMLHVCELSPHVFRAVSLCVFTHTHTTTHSRHHFIHNKVCFLLSFLSSFSSFDLGKGGQIVYVEERWGETKPSVSAS